MSRSFIEEVGAEAAGMARPSSHRTQGALGARGAAGDWDSGTYLYDGAGNVRAIGASRFVYDALSRLTDGRVVANGSTHTQTVQFDPFGNLTRNFTTTFGTRNLPTTTWNNHLTSGTYDHAGSLASWNLWSYEWDPVAMMRRRTTAGRDWRFFYTAGDERFWSVDLGTWATSDFTLRDLDGKVLRVYEAAGGKWSRFTDYVWRGEALLARDFAYTRPESFHLDHLGTPRLLTNHRAERLAQPNYFPFGEEITAETQVAERMKFTGHERDTLGTPGVADDLDYMHARYANPITGRFLSVDPVLQIRRSMRRPQLWNRYSYSIGNPIKYTDPSGMVVVLSGTIEAQTNSLEALRNTVPRELRVFLRTRYDKDGQLVIDSQALRKASGGMSSANFRALLVIAASEKLFELGTIAGEVATATGSRTLGGSAMGLFLDQGGDSPRSDRSFIWVANDLDQLETVKSFAHEVRHAALFALGQPFIHEMGLFEVAPSVFDTFDPNGPVNILTKAAEDEARANYETN